MVLSWFFGHFFGLFLLAQIACIYIYIYIYIYI